MRDPYRPLLPFSLIPRRVVDALPQRWWALGNLHLLPLTTASLHFCSGPLGDESVSVRTIELRRIFAWGRTPFDYEASERDGESLAARTLAEDERKYGPLPPDQEDE